MYVHGVDELGNPLIIVDFAKINLEEFLLADYVDYGVFVVEFLLKSGAVASGVEKWVLLLDMAGRWFEEMTIISIENLVKTFAANYPMRLHSIHIVNAPTALNKVLRIFDHFLPAAVTDKVIIEEGSVP
jgi:hypothetical protein